MKLHIDVTEADIEEGGVHAHSCPVAERVRSLLCQIFPNTDWEVLVDPYSEGLLVCDGGRERLRIAAHDLPSDLRWFAKNYDSWHSNGKKEERRPRGFACDIEIPLTPPPPT